MVLCPICSNVMVDYEQIEFTEEGERPKQRFGLLCPNCNFKF